MSKRQMRIWMRPVATGFTASVLAVGCVSAESGAPVAAAPVVTAPAAVTAAPHDKPGFITQLDERDGRLWVFREGSEELAKFKAEGRPARHVLRPGAGPLGLTLKSTESEIIVDYIVAQPGFYTEVDSTDGRLWVFTEGSEDLESFKTKGKPARQVLRPGAGPLGLTLKSTEADVLDAYQARF